MPSDRRDARERVTQGAVLVAGAVLLALVVGGESSRFYLVPAGLGLVYLAAALAGGPRGGLWATALVVLGFGVAVVVIERADPALAGDGLELLGAGLGALAGAALARRGVAVDPLGVAATIALVGLLAALRTEWSFVTDAFFYAAFVGLVGLLNVVLGAVGLGRERRSGAPSITHAERPA